MRVFFMPAKAAGLGSVLWIVFLVGALIPARVAYGLDPLWLSLAPATVDGVACDEHGGAQAGRARPGATSFESEHRPQPLRTYWLNTDELSPAARALIRHPDGSVQELPLKHQETGISVSMKLAMGDGVCHGPNTVYVVDQAVEDGVLVVRTAQWLCIHHNCGWGHDYRFDRQRLAAASLPTVPFEIVINDLWDQNFHVRVTSGETIAVQAVQAGKPVAGARISVTTEEQWSKSRNTDQDGLARIQLIRDYFPASWQEFRRDRQSSFKVSAVYEQQEMGEYQGQPYEKIRYLATLPWRYTPGSMEYSSYAAGLFFGSLAFVGTGVGVYGYRERRRKTYREITLDE